MSSTDEDHTFMTGGGESSDHNTTINRHSDNLPLSRAHLSPTRVGMSARETILSAVETLEVENEQLRKVNNQILSELEELRAENDQLRKDLDCALRERDGAFEDNRTLEEKIRKQNKHFTDENRKLYTLESSLKQENDSFKKQFEALKSEFSRKENDIRILGRELDNMRNKLEKATRKNTQQKDVEAFHEIEMLKVERNDLAIERDDALKNNKRLTNELKKLENTLEEKLSELRNENRRHSLLTKEFNSLLEENNHLKLQLRRRRQGTNTLGVKAEMGESKTREISVSSPPQSSRFSYTTSLSRDTSPLSSVDVTSVPKIHRERTLMSRERVNPRERSAARSDASYQSSGSNHSSRRAHESEQEFILDRFGERKLITKRSTTGSRSDSDSSPPPDGLPNISGGKTWRP